MGGMIQFRRARYCLEPPAWAEASSTEEPMFLAPAAIRPAWRRAIRRVATTPGLVLDAHRAGLDVRAVLRFSLWLDSARCFGVTELIAAEPAVRAFGRHLPPAPAQAAARRPTVTALVLARNEAGLLGHALSSLTNVADDVVVVDDHSDDDTDDVARAAGARVLTRRLDNDFAAQRNAGLALVRTDWVIAIDADEVLEPDLTTLLTAVLARTDADAVFVPRLNRIRERGDEPWWWPDLRPCVFRAHLRYRGPLHEQVAGWRSYVVLPVSGPYLLHEKDLLRQHRATLFYDAIDPNSPYSPSTIASIKEEVARLERGLPAKEPDAEP